VLTSEHGLALKRTAVAIATLLAACALACDSVGPHVYRVPTGAMVPTIKVGQYVVVMRWPGAVRVARGDIVVFRAPGEPDKLWIKRAIALEGEEIELRHRHLFIEGKDVEEPYAAWFSTFSPSVTDSLENYGPIKVPEGQIVVMGDNRFNSKDSRVFGPIPLKSVVGWVVLGPEHR